MMVEYDKELYTMLEHQVSDELGAIIRYDEILEKLKAPEHDQHRHTILNIQEDQSVHMLEIVNIMNEMGMPEAKSWQKLEDFLLREKIEDKKD